MAANTQPIFALVPETKIVTVTAATTDRTGATTTNLVELLTAGTDGTKITQIGAKVAGTNAATLVLIFITDTAGTNPKLFDEIVINAVTPSTIARSFRNSVAYDDLQLKSGQKVFVGTTVAITDGVNVFAIKGDY
jgi:hypothetical protein